MGIKHFTHIGICVSNMEKSLEFYRQALGFEPTREILITDTHATLLQIPDLILHSQFIERDNCSLELLWFESPGHIGETAFHPMNTLGFAHLSFTVADIEDVIAKIVQYGGSTHPETRMTRTRDDGTRVELMFCQDPDGVRVELVNELGPG